MSWWRKYDKRGRQSVATTNQFERFAPEPSDAALLEREESRGVRAMATRDLRAAALALWKDGFRRRFGREPQMDDLILMREVVRERIRAE